jgi:hypothetical protein
MKMALPAMAAAPAGRGHYRQGGRTGLPCQRGLRGPYDVLEPGGVAHTSMSEPPPADEAARRLRRDFPRHSEPSLTRTYHYLQRDLARTIDYIRASERQDEGLLCTPACTTPANGWKTQPLPWRPPMLGVAAGRRPGTPDGFQVSHSMQAMTEREWLSELEGQLAVAARSTAIGAGGAGRPPSAARRGPTNGGVAAAAAAAAAAAGTGAASAAPGGGGRRPRSAGAVAASRPPRPWQVGRAAAPRVKLEAQHWSDTGEPCLLCRRQSNTARGHSVLTSEFGLCRGCQAYYAALSADDRPDLDVLQWDEAATSLGTRLASPRVAARRADAGGTWAATVAAQLAAAALPPQPGRETSAAGAATAAAGKAAGAFRRRAAGSGGGRGTCINRGGGVRRPSQRPAWGGGGGSGSPHRRERDPAVARARRQPNAKAAGRGGGGARGGRGGRGARPLRPFRRPF